jgi:hypothetical protein
MRDINLKLTYFYIKNNRLCDLKYFLKDYSPTRNRTSCIPGFLYVVYLLSLKNNSFAGIWLHLFYLIENYKKENYSGFKKIPE